MVHRFYIGNLHDKRGPVELRGHIWVHDEHLLSQWLKVLKLRVGEEIELFDDTTATKLYQIDKIEEGSVGLALVTEVEPTVPKKHTYLFWCLLKKDNNELVLQKCTELGVTNFVPLIGERTEKTGFDGQRAKRILIEASEQCGRSDIPRVREPITINEALAEYKEKIDLYVADKSGEDNIEASIEAQGIFIGPEGGWAEAELSLFLEVGIKGVNLHDLTLRAETAAIAGVAKLVQ